MPGAGYRTPQASTAHFSVLLSQSQPALAGPTLLFHNSSCAKVPTAVYSLAAGPQEKHPQLTGQGEHSPGQSPRKGMHGTPHCDLEQRQETRKLLRPSTLTPLLWAVPPKSASERERSIDGGGISSDRSPCLPCMDLPRGSRSVGLSLCFTLHTHTAPDAFKMQTSHFLGAASIVQGKEGRP